MSKLIVLASCIIMSQPNKTMYCGNEEVMLCEESDLSLLHKAVMIRSFEQVQMIIQHDGFLGVQDAEGNTPLHKAVDSGDKEIVELLLEHKADVNAPNQSGCTPLYLAIANNDKDIVMILLKHGASIAAQDGTETTPLQLAAYLGHREIAKLLVCASFMPAHDNPLVDEHSLKGQIFKKLLKEMHTYAFLKKNQLMLQDWSADMLAGHVPLVLQQEIAQAWQQDGTSLSRQQLKFLLSAHAQRHLAAIKRALRIQNIDRATARDIAQDENHPDIMKLFDQVNDAQTYTDLEQELQDMLIAHRESRLNIKSEDTLFDEQVKETSELIH